MMTHWIASLLTAATLATSSPIGPQWNNDYGDALESTRATARPLLIVIESPSDDSSRFLPARFAPDETGEELLKPYELCRIDIDTSYGQRVAEAFQVTQFPYTAIIDKAGRKIIFHKSGRISASEWAATLIAYRAGQSLPLNGGPQAEKNEANCFT